jgi:hypothetical protein
MRWYVLDERGEPVPTDDVEAAGQLLDDVDAQRVALDERGGVRVSTVFLVLDHSHGSGRPVLYETMVFGGPHDQYQERYATRAEAVAGHRVACELAFGRPA